jgi:hypothetical protein
MKFKTIAKLGIAPLALLLATGVASAQMQVAPAPRTAPSSPMLSKSAMQGNAYQVPLSQIDNPRHVIAHADVVDRDGNSVGSVHDVRMNPDGSVNRIHIDVGGVLGIGSKIVALSPAGLRYERDKNELITNLTKDEIKDLPESKG